MAFQDGSFKAGTHRRHMSVVMRPVTAIIAAPFLSEEKCVLSPKISLVHCRDYAN